MERQGHYAVIHKGNWQRGESGQTTGVRTFIGSGGKDDNIQDGTYLNYELKTTYAQNLV